MNRSTSDKWWKIHRAMRAKHRGGATWRSGWSADHRALGPSKAHTDRKFGCSGPCTVLRSFCVSAIYTFQFRRGCNSSYPAAGGTLPISLFTTTHSSSDGPVAGAGRVDKQASSTCERSMVCLKIFFRLPYLFSRHVSIFSFKSLRRATELEMHDASRICCLLVAVISNASSIC